MRRSILVPCREPVLLLVLLLLSLSVSAEDFSFVLETQWTVSGGTVSAAAFSPDGSWLAICVGKRCTLFHLGESGRPTSRGEISASRKEILDVAVAPDGNVIASVDASGALHLHDGSSATRISTIAKAHPGRAQAVGFTHDGNYVLTGGSKGTVKAWTPQGAFFAELGEGARHGTGIVMVDGTSPGRNAISVDQGGRVILWNVDTQRAIRPSDVDMDVLSATVSRDGRVLALGLQRLEGNLFRSSTFASARETKATDTVRLIDTERGTTIRDLEGSDQELRTVSLSPDSRFVASGGSGNSAAIWSTATGQVVTSIPFEQPASTLAFSPNGRWLAAGTRGGVVSLYRLQGVEPPRPPVAETPLVIVIIEPDVVIIRSGTSVAKPTQVTTPSLRIKGRIKTSSPIKTLQVDGQEITSLVVTDTDDYLFTAYVSMPSAGRKQIDVVVENQARQANNKSFVVERVEQDPPAQVGPGRRIALLIGISSYADQSINLDYASNDAQALYELLTSPELGPAAFKPDDVRLLIDEEATVTNINIGLRQYLQRARETDFVLVFFAGHGMPDPNRLQDLYLMAYDSSPTDIAGTGLLMRHFREAVAELRARDVFIVTDSCHSAGVAAPRSVRSATRANPIHQEFLKQMRHSSGGMTIFTASEAAQESFENARWRLRVGEKKWSGHGVFTYYLLKGLQGEADRDSNSIVTVGEIMEYVRDHVRDETGMRQIPAIGATSFDRELPVVTVQQQE